MAFSVDDAAFLNLLAKSADRGLADQATSALSGMVLKFDPEELRDDHGRWSAVGVAVHAIELAAEDVSQDGPAPEPGRDKLKLHGKIRLGSGERLVGSGKVSDEYGSVRLAATENDGARSLRIGVGNSTFGTRDGGGPWTGGPDHHAAAQAEAEAAAAEYEQLLQRFDDLPNGHPDRAALGQRMDALDESDAAGEVMPGGYTTRLDEAGADRLRSVLADVRQRAPEAQRRADAAWDQVPVGTSYLDAVERMRAADPDIDQYGALVLASGSIPGEWGDLHYEADIDEPASGVRMRLAVVPPGMTRDQVAEEETDYVLTPADMAKLERQLDALMPSAAGKASQADLLKWTYNPNQSRIGGRFASGTGSNITSGGDVVVSGRQGTSIVAAKPVNAAAARLSSGKPVNGAAARLTPQIKPPAGKPKPQAKPTKPEPKPKPAAKPAPKPTPGPEAATRSPHTGIGSQDGDRLTVSHRSTEQTRQADARQRSHDAAVRARQRAELNAVRASLAAARAKAKASTATTKQRDVAVNAMRDKYGIPKSLRHVSKDRQQAASDMASSTRQMVTDRARIASAQAQVAAVRAQYRKGQSAQTTAYLNSQLAKAQARLNAASGALSADQKTFDAAAKKWRGH